MIRDRNSFRKKMLTKDPKTQHHYEMTLDDFDKWLDGRKITQDNAEDLVQDFVNWFSLEAWNHRRKIKGHSPNYVWNHYSRIKKYLRHLKITIDEIELPAKHEKELHPLKLSEMHTIFSVLRYDDQTLFGCQACAGMRIGESVQLKKRYFIWVDDRLVIKIPSHIAKFKKARTTVLTKEMSFRVKKILDRIDDNDLVFGTSENYHHSEINKEEILRNALHRTGLDNRYEDTGNFEINTHSFRAWFITHVSRHDPNIAKKMAGEKGYMLQYDRLSDEDYVENAKKFEADLTIFNLAKRDQMANKKQMEVSEQLNKQDKKISEQQKQIDDLLNLSKLKITTKE